MDPNAAMLVLVMSFEARIYPVVFRHRAPSHTPSLPITSRARLRFSPLFGPQNNQLKAQRKAMFEALDCLFCRDLNRPF